MTKDVLTRNLFGYEKKSRKKSNTAQNSSYKKYTPLSPEERQIVSTWMFDIARTVPNPKRSNQMKREADRFCHCGSQYSMFDCISDRMTFRVPISCNSRICDICGRRYASRLEDSIKSIFENCIKKRVKGYFLSMLTLTTTTKRFKNESPGRADIERFYRESSKFLKLYYGKYKCKVNSNGDIIEDQCRYSEIGSTRVKRKPKVRIGRNGKKIEDWRRFRGAGFIASTEIGSKNNMLHLHAIVYGPYIRQSLLQKVWLDLTGDSWHIAINPIDSVDNATKYVLKYIMKPPDFDSYKDLASYAYMIKGTRRIRSGGIFYNRIRRYETEKLTPCCPYCGGILHYEGKENIKNLDNHYSYNLYDLLKQARAGPLKIPEDHAALCQAFNDIFDFPRK